jgi:hypothetical protein
MIPALLLLSVGVAVGAEKELDEKKLIAALEARKANVDVDAQMGEGPYLVVKFDQPRDFDLEAMRFSKIVRVLQIYDSSKLTEKGFTLIKTIANLEKLSLGKARPTANGLAGLKELKRLESLYLGEAVMGDPGANYLKEITSLKQLDLSHTNLGDRGLQALSSIEHLEALNVSNTKVTDEGIKLFSDKSTLKLLDVQNTKVTTPMIKNLEESIKGIKIMR